MNYKVKNEVLTVCEVKINYYPKVKPSERPQIFGPTHIYSLLMENGIFTPETIEHREFFKVLLLNNAKKLPGIVHLSEGSVNQTVVNIRHIMQSVILSNATGIVLCHNHPSGNLQPSLHDDRLTLTIKKACELVGVELEDHLIVTSEAYLSYAEEGKL